MSTKEVTIAVVGPPGSGKSAIAQIIAQALIEAGVRCSVCQTITIRPQSHQDRVISSIAVEENGTNVTILERSCQ